MKTDTIRSTARRLALMPAALALALHGACARLPEPGRLAGGAAAVEVPSRFHGGHVYVRIALGEADTAWLLLDSGAQVTVLDERVAAGLDERPAGSSRLTGYGEARLEGSVLRDLATRLPGAHPFESTVPVVDLSALDPHAGVSFDGFLGAPLFRRFVVEIDYGAQRVVLHDADSFLPDAGYTRLTLELERGTAFVDGALELEDGSVLRGRFVVDSGMRAGLSLGSPFVAEHDLIERASRTVPEPVVGIGGRSLDRLARLRAFRLGPLVLDAPTVQLSTTAAGAAGEAGRAGSIGADLLRRFTVLFDYRRRALYLRPNEAFNDPFDGDMSGASFTAAGENLELRVVDFVATGSPAAAAGLAVGDTLVRVDGRDAGALPLAELHELLRSAPGRVIALVVRRGGVLVPLPITLERRV